MAKTIKKTVVIEDDKNFSGVTKTGFKFEIPKDNFNDAELLEVLMRVDDGEKQYLLKAAEMLLGKEQKTALYDHCRNKNGKVPTDKVIIEIGDIFASCKEIKK